MYSVWRNDWHGRMGGLLLDQPPEIVVSGHDGGAGKDGGSEIVITGEVHPRGAWG